MFLETKEIKEYHANGQLRYTCTIGVIAPLFQHLYVNGSRLHPDGYHWVRVGNCSKYFDNGQLGWQVNYDNMGNPTPEKFISYRKDGSIIQP